jgi:hypothetical protein
MKSLQRPTKNQKNLQKFTKAAGLINDWRSKFPYSLLRNARETQARDELGISKINRPDLCRRHLLQQFLHCRWCTLIGFDICAFAGYTDFTIWLFYNFPCHLKCSCCKSRRVFCKKIDTENLYLRYFCNGYQDWQVIFLAFKCFIIRRYFASSCLKASSISSCLPLNSCLKCSMFCNVASSNL